MKTPSIAEFVEAAKDYCEFVNSQSNSLEQARNLLLRLIFHIPAIHSAQHKADHKGERLPKDKTDQIMKRFSELDFDYYQMVFSPLEIDKEDEPVMGFLPDDLTDIYIDLHEGLGVYESGHQQDAYFDWSWSYKSHWGSHAINALKAIETYINENYA